MGAPPKYINCNFRHIFYGDIYRSIGVRKSSCFKYDSESTLCTLMSRDYLSELPSLVLHISIFLDFYFSGALFYWVVLHWYIKRESYLLYLHLKKKVWVQLVELGLPNISKFRVLKLLKENLIHLIPHWGN